MKQILSKKHFNKLKQGASKKRIGQYLRKLLGWGLVVCLPMSYVHAAPGDAFGTANGSCSAFNLGAGNGIGIRYQTPTVTIFGTTQELLLDGAGPRTGITTAGQEIFLTFSLTLPSSTSTIPTTSADEPSGSALPQTVYVSGGTGSSGEVCTAEYILTGVGASLTRTIVGTVNRVAPVNVATPVPTLSQWGLILLSFMLMAFGWRNSQFFNNK